MTLADVLVLVAAVLAGVEVVTARGRSLLAWAVLLIAVALLLRLL